MKHDVKRLLAMCLVLVLALAACGPKPVQPLPSVEPSAQPTAEGMDVKLAVLSGPTGVGAAKLIADSGEGRSVNHYDVKVCTENSEVTAGLLNGDFDIAAIATNVAATLYNKSEGAIQIAAVNTLGVLYILGPAGEPITDLAQLRGQTLYATGQGANPEFVLNYLLGESGVAGEVEVVWGPADEVNVAMLQGQGKYCMLPVPAATALEAKSEGKITAQISLSEVWDELDNGSQLTMGCVAVRTEFAQAHPEAVGIFLEEYAESIAYMSDPANMAVSSELNPAELVANYGIAPNAAIAGKAIPQCNLVCLTGEDMRDTIQGYYEVLYAADPAAIGGSIPDDGFYFFAG